MDKKKKSKAPENTEQLTGVASFRAAQEEAEAEGDFGPNIYTITDEEGTEYFIEHLDSLEHNGKEYMSFCEADIPDDEAPEMIIFEVVTDDATGEEQFATIEDEDVLEEIYDLFMDRLYDN